MKVIFLLLGASLLLAAAGCAGIRGEHQGGAYGGSSQDYPDDRGYGQGEYLGYPNYPEYRDRY